MDLYTPPTPTSPSPRSGTASNTPYTSYTRPQHHRKRVSALRLSSDTTSTLPEYLPTIPNTNSTASWRSGTGNAETDDAPPDYFDSAEEADEDTDLSEEENRKQLQRSGSVFVTVGINSAPPTATTFTSPPTPRGSRLKRAPFHRRKRSSPSVNLGSIRSSSDIYLDSLLERSVHALEMSNALLQSSISTKTSLSGILNQDTDEDEDLPTMSSSAMLPSRPGSGSGMHSLERSAHGLTSRIMGNRDIHETWVEDLEQISRDVDRLFSEDAQEEPNQSRRSSQDRNRGRMRRTASGSTSSQGSISASLPAASSSSPLHSYQSLRHRPTLSGFASQQQQQQRASKHPSRKTSLDSRTSSLQSQTLSPRLRYPEEPRHTVDQRHDELAGVPHLRYDTRERERFVSHPPRALTQYVSAEGDVRHGHEYGYEAGGSHDRNGEGTGKDQSRENRETQNKRESPSTRNSRDSRKSRLKGKDTEDDDETIMLPSTLGLRSSGTYSTLRERRLSPSRSRSRSPPKTVPRSKRQTQREIDGLPESSSSHSHLRITVDPPAPSSSSSRPSLSSPSSSSHQPTRAPNAYNLLSSFVYPSSASSSTTSSLPQRSNSLSAASRGKGKASPLGSPWGSRRGSTNSASERLAFKSTLNGSSTSKRLRSASPAASMSSTKTTSTVTSGSGSSTATAGSGCRSRSQTPKPLGTGSGPGFLSSLSSGRRNMTPPLEVSSGSGEGSGGECEGFAERREESEEHSSSDSSCPTKQTILSLRKILDAHKPPRPGSDEWTFIAKPPALMQQTLKAGSPLEAGTSNATASISKLFTRGVHSHEGSVTRARPEGLRPSSFKGKGRASASASASAGNSNSNSAAPTAPATPTSLTASPLPASPIGNGSGSGAGKMGFSMSIPELLSAGVSLALSTGSPLPSKPPSGASTPATPGHAKRISFAELPEGTAGIGAEGKGKKRKGKSKGKRDSSGRSGSGSRKGSARRRRSESEDDADADDAGMSNSWFGWLIGASGGSSSGYGAVSEGGRPDRAEVRGWSGLGSTSRGPGYGSGLDEWGI